MREELRWLKLRCKFTGGCKKHNGNNIKQSREQTGKTDRCGGKKGEIGIASEEDDAIDDSVDWKLAWFGFECASRSASDLPAAIFFGEVRNCPGWI